MPKRSAPSRRDRGGYPTRTEGRKILILSDGTETEPNYFSALKRAWGLAALRVPRQALGRAPQVIAEAVKERGSYDEVWCVVDKDDLDDGAFNAAIARCIGKVRPAWSNESFELWFVLHYTNAPARGINARDRYIEQLDRLMPKNYYKAADHWTTLEPLLATALQNADALMAQYTGGESPATCCPGTRVQDLIRTLQAERAARG